MQIGCTKKLLDYMGIKPIPADAAADPVLSWSANLININRRRAIVVANDSSRYGFVLYGVKAEHIKKFHSIIVGSIRACLEAECIAPELIDKYMDECGDITFTKTANRSVVSRLNNLCERVYYYDYSQDELLQSNILSRLNDDYIGNKDGYFSPYEKLAEDIATRYDATTAYRSRAVEIDVELEGICQRRIIVPLNYTFLKLHKALQKLFCWQGYHLHDFWIERYPNGRLKHTLVGIPREDPYDGETTRPDSEVRLSEIFPAYDNIIYNYDFGDNWIHHIRLIRIINDYDKNFPVCIYGEGNAPPEDVGGHGGYEEMLRILANPDDPEYSDMKTWVEEMRWKPFDIDQINRVLSRLR